MAESINIKDLDLLLEESRRCNRILSKKKKCL